MKGLIVLTGLFGLFFAVLLGGAYALDSASCHAKYSQWSPSYGLLEGCQVVVNGGRRIPSDSLRGGELQ